MCLDGPLFVAVVLAMQPTILDLHSGALSKGTKFVDFYKLISDDDRQELEDALQTYKYTPSGCVCVGGGLCHLLF